MLKILKLFNFLLDSIVYLAIVFTLAVSGYMLWYNSQVYAAVDNVRSDLYALKPTVTDESGPSFDELRAINPDVVAWLTVDDTYIDYPVLQGENNMTYMNTDVYGQFSLAGSIFLDSRNNKDFSDPYSIVYGHHMENHAMFGDLDLFRDPDFFESHRTAVILTDEGEKDYQVLAYAELPDSVREVFEPSTWENGLAGIETTIKKYSTNIWDSAMEELIAYPDSVDIVALVTCASGSTGTRTVVFLITRRPSVDEPMKTPDSTVTRKESFTTTVEPVKTGGTLWNSALLWNAMIKIIGCILCLLLLIYRKEINNQSEH